MNKISTTLLMPLNIAFKMGTCMITIALTGNNVSLEMQVFQQVNGKQEVNT